MILPAARIVCVTIVGCTLACHRTSTSQSSSHSETSTVTDSTSSESGATTTVTTTSEAPGKTTTTVEEFQPPPPEEVMPSVPDEHGGSLQSDGGVPATQGAVSKPSHGPLVRRTVTVTEHGEKDTTARQEASTQAAGASETRAQGKTEAQAQSKTERKPALSCAFASWMWGVLVIVAVAGLVWGALKVRKTFP